MLTLLGLAALAPLSAASWAVPTPGTVTIRGRHLSAGESGGAWLPPAISSALQATALAPPVSPPPPAWRLSDDTPLLLRSVTQLPNILPHAGTQQFTLASPLQDERRAPAASPAASRQPAYTHTARRRLRGASSAPATVGTTPTLHVSPPPPPQAPGAPAASSSAALPLLSEREENIAISFGVVACIVLLAAAAWACHHRGDRGSVKSPGQLPSSALYRSRDLSANSAGSPRLSTVPLMTMASSGAGSEQLQRQRRLSALGTGRGTGSSGLPQRLSSGSPQCSNGAPHRADAQPLPSLAGLEGDEEQIVSTIDLYLEQQQALVVVGAGRPVLATQLSAAARRRVAEVDAEAEASAVRGAALWDVIRVAEQREAAEAAANAALAAHNNVVGYMPGGLKRMPP